MNQKSFYPLMKRVLQLFIEHLIYMRIYTINMAELGGLVSTIYSRREGREYHESNFEVIFVLV